MTDIQKETAEIKTHSKDYQDGVKIALQVGGTSKSIAYAMKCKERSEDCLEGFQRGLDLAVKILESLPQMKKAKSEARS